MSGIIRVKKDARYFVASNEPFNDEKLSWEARGVMGYLLNKPDGWEIRNHDLVKKGPAGEYKIKRIIAELKKGGYIHRYRQHKGNGTFEWVTEVYESPSLNPHKDNTIGRKPPDGEQNGDSSDLTIGRLSIDGSPIDGKPHHIVSTELASTDLVNTKTTTTTATAPKPEKKTPVNGSGSSRQFSSKDLGEVSRTYESEVGLLSPHIAETLKDWLGTYPPGWIVDAIKKASEQNKRKLAYIRGILANWETDGRDSPKPNNGQPKLTTEQLEAYNRHKAESELSRRKD